MLEQLFSLIQQEGQNDIINNSNIPNVDNNQAIGIATESVFSGLQNVLANGGLDQVMGLFSGNAAVNESNPLVGGIMNQFVNNIMDRLGLESGVAKSIAMSLIPMVLGKLVSRTNDSNNNQFDINNILGTLLGGKSNHGGAVALPNRNQPIDFGGLLSKVSQGGGLDIDGDGDVDMQDILAAVSGAAGSMQQNQQQQSGGGVMDLIGGLLK
jgi:hypothetical protein